MAPSHTFDLNTLEALRLESDIRVISDTVANDAYERDGFFFLPQQSGRVRELRMRLATFCYHPNTATDESFEELEAFLRKHAREFAAFEDVPLRKRPRDVYDKILSRLYFLRRALAAKLRG